MRLRWLLPIGHTLINAVLVSALFFSPPEDRRSGPGSVFLLYGQEEQVSFDMGRSNPCSITPRALWLLAIGNWPAQLITSIWYPLCVYSTRDVRASSALQIPVSMVLWFLLGIYFEGAPHPHIVGKRFLAVRVGSLALLSWWSLNLVGVFMLIWLGFFCLLGYRGLRAIWVRLSPAGV